MKRDKIFGIIFIILGILIMLAPTVIAPTCGPMENGMFMKCHWMGRSAMGVGVIIAILGAAYTYVCSKKAKSALAFALLLQGAYTIALETFLIGGCKKPMMACRAHTMPVLYLLAGIVIVLSLISLILNRGSNESCGA